MSLNRYEDALYRYWEREPEERRHWQAKVVALAAGTALRGELARALERELWEYFQERSSQVPLFRDLAGIGLRRVSLLNLAEHLFRLWGPPPRPKPNSPGDSRTPERP